MKKVFIIGAGASWDFGFPSGMELMQEIYLLWNSPSKETITNYARTMEQLRIDFTCSEEEETQIVINKIKKLSARLYFSGADSIDDFLSQCKDKVDVQFGKLAILKIIFEKEQRAKEFGDKAVFKWEENWLRVLFGAEFRPEDVKKLEDKLEKDQFYFVIFNYDRCVEHFLYTAIQNYYGLKADETKNIMNKMGFDHIYGQLAPLHWQAENNPVNFGDAIKGGFDKLYCFVSNIKIVNEDRNDVENIKSRISAQIGDAGKVYILGFGFQDSNWRLLGIDKYKEHPAKGLSWSLDKFYYTQLGLSNRRKEYIQKELFGLKPLDSVFVKSYDSTVYEFMHHNYT